MTIDVNDWPIDPYTVDGVELAARLNKVIPSEINAINSGKANLSGGNTWSGNQTYNGVVRFQASMTGTGISGLYFQTSTANTLTRINVVPNGTGTQAGLYVYNSSTGANCAYGVFTVTAAETQIYSAILGTGTYLPLSIYTGGYVRLQIATNGAVNLRNSITGSCGILTLGNDDLSISRRFTVRESDSAIIIYNQAVSGASMNLSDTGVPVFYGGLVVAQLADGSGAGMSSVKVSTSYYAKLSERFSGNLVQVIHTVSVGAWFTAGNDGTVHLGSPAIRWNTVYAAVGTINTSDAREKTPIRDLSAAEMRIARKLASGLGVYRWLTEVEEKGDSALDHFGITAQQVVSEFEKEGLDAHLYGMISHDVMEARPPTYSETEVDEDGEPVMLDAGYAAVDRYGMNYNELANFILRGLYQNQLDMEARIAALEAAASPIA